MTVSALLCGLRLAEAQQYAVTDLATLGGSYPFSRAYAVNDLGQVVGVSNVSGFGSHRAFFWDDGTMVNLGTLSGGSSSYAFGINDLGQVVGYSTMNIPEIHAFLWEGGPLIDLGTLGGNLSHASGINDDGQIVGDSNDIGCMWEGGVISPIGVPRGFAGSSAHAINTVSHVAGHAWYCLGCPTIDPRMTKGT